MWVLIRKTGSRRRCRRVLAGWVLIVSALFSCPGRASAGTDPAVQSDTIEETETLSSGIRVRRLTLPVKGIDREYHLLLISDLHIIPEEDPQVDEDKKENVRQRREDYFHTSEGVFSDQLWETLPAELDAQNADMVLFAGDMTDYCTKAATEALKKGFDALSTPWMFVRGDHDYGAWNSYRHETQKDAIRMQADIAPRKKVMEMETGNLTVIGWDNSTSQMTEEGLKDLTWYLSEAEEKKRTVLFLCHVPLIGDVTDQLAEKSREIWDRNLLWGDGDEDCYYQPDETTKAALDLVLEEGGPVRLVCSGHLHFPYAGPLTDSITQIVAAPAYEGTINEIILKP